jgi:hypothetical protein
VLEGLGGAAARQAADDLEQFARLGGLMLVARDSPWARSPVVSADEARRADEVLDEVRRHALPTAAGMLGRASRETGLPGRGHWRGGPSWPPCGRQLGRPCRC